jgi:hypothetical protein
VAGHRLWADVKAEGLAHAERQPATQEEGEPGHPQVQIRHGWNVASVDEGMAEVILACWRAGVETLHSCQDTRVSESVGTWAYIHFPAVSADKFLRRMMHDEEIADHIMWPEWAEELEDLLLDGGELTDEQCAAMDAFEATYLWQWSAHALGWDGVAVAVHFPASDIPAITRTLNER